MYNVLAQDFVKKGLNRTKSKSGFFRISRPGTSERSISKSGSCIWNTNSPFAGVEAARGLATGGGTLRRLAGETSGAAWSVAFLLKWFNIEVLEDIVRRGGRGVWRPFWAVGRVADR